MRPISAARCSNAAARDGIGDQRARAERPAQRPRRPTARRSRPRCRSAGVAVGAVDRRGAATTRVELGAAAAPARAARLRGGAAPRRQFRTSSVQSSGRCRGPLSAQRLLGARRRSGPRPRAASASRRRLHHHPHDRLGARAAHHHPAPVAELGLDLARPPPARRGVHRGRRRRAEAHVHEHLRQAGHRRGQRRQRHARARDEIARRSAR